MLNVQLSGQTSLRFDYLMSAEFFRSTYFDGIKRFSGSINTQFSELFQGELYFTVGRSIARNTEVPALGKVLSGGGSFTLKPLDRLNVQQSIDFSQLDYPTGENIFKGAVLRTRLNYQHSRELSVRIVVQYDSFSHDLRFEPLISYKLNPFSIFYIGSTNRWHNFYEEHVPGSNEYFDDALHQSSRSYFFKLQYLFQV